jgi:Ca2+-binding RTX toxin-like protein
MSINFNAATPYLVGLNPNSIAIGDLNNDTNLDIVTGGIFDPFFFSARGGFSALLGNGLGGFASSISSQSPEFGAAGSIAVGDFDNDTKLDVITTGKFGSSISDVHVALGDGTGKFTAKTNITVGNSPQSVSVGDINADNKLDAVTANLDSNTLSVLLGDGLGGLTSGVPVTLDGNPRAIALDDVNADTKLDLVALTTKQNTAKISLLPGNGNGTFADPTSTVNLGDATSFGSFDIATTNDFTFNGQNRVAVATVTGGKVSVLLFDPVKGLQLVFQTEQNAHAVVAQDFNGDGRMDLATTATNGNLTHVATVMLGDGAGRFSRPVEFTTTGSNNFSVEDLEWGDFNKDNKPDLVATNPSFTSASVLLNITTQTDAIAKGTTIVNNQQIGFIDASSELSGALSVDLSKKKFVLKGISSKPSLQGVDDIIGTKQADDVIGNQRANFLNGVEGKDTLNGLGGDDRLVGGANNDELSSGKGKDRFIFTSTTNYPEGLEKRFTKALLGVDQIIDFELGKDKIVLDAGTFTNLAPGQKVRFATVDNLKEAKSSNALITYNQSLGQLYYNQNGKQAGLGSGGLFADLQNEVNLQAKDFSVFL